MAPKLTLKTELSFSGVGIHSGADVRLSLKPWAKGSIVFRRLDLGGREIALDPRKTRSANRSSLVSGGVRIQTIEHLLAALSAYGIDSLIAELDGEEIPALDGSALEFARAVAGAGTVPLAAEKKSVRILRPFLIEEGPASLEGLAGPGFRVDYVIDFDHPAIGRQELALSLTPEVFLAEIAPARTFGFLKDVPELYRRGLAMGGSFSNAIILDDEKVLNGPLRFPDEFVRHKALDLIGDLYLLGAPLLGCIRVVRGGHALHLRAVQFLKDNPEYWEWA